VTSKKSASSNEAVLSFVYDDAASARRIERAIRPEVGDIDGDRSLVSVSREGAELELTVTAADLVALRAGLNTWCSLVSVAEDAGDVIE
jgi:KEOPS complex subunit Pcc1